MACELDLDIRHFDIEQAFVQSDLEKRYLRYRILRLNRSLCGLKQASRQWHAHRTRCLQTFGFLQWLACACVFRLMEQGSIVMTIVMHVDNIFAVGDQERCDQLGRDLNNGSGQEPGRVALVFGVFI